MWRGSSYSTRGWVLAATLAVLPIAACGGGESGDSPAEGGASSTAGSGGTADTSGGTTSGGSGVGGSTSGGSTSGGASTGTGGKAGSGGKAGTGGAGASGGASTSGGATASGGSGGGAGACSDACPLATGLTYGCKRRFALGVNYAWHTFAGDFGGIPKWSMKSLSQTEATYSTELAQMASNGVSVVRWWMFPDFRGGGVEFDASNDATGLSALAKTDIAKALELAEANDLYLVLTIFSFDNFRADRTENNALIRGMAPMVSSATRRAKLIANVVRPTAQAVAASPHAQRLLGWDIINEPEWAISPAGGSAPMGRDFTPNTNLSPVSLANMKALINESAAALHEETPNALVSVGWAAAKWAWAFGDVAVDFHQPHIYAWVNEYWPYTQTPAQLGYGTKPVVFGEFFLQQMPFDTSDTFAQILSSWWDHGYAGAWSWQYNQNKANLGLIKTFAQQKGCSAGYQ